MPDSRLDLFIRLYVQGRGRLSPNKPACSRTSPARALTRRSRLCRRATPSRPRPHDLGACCVSSLVRRAFCFSVLDGPGVRIALPATPDPDLSRRASSRPYAERFLEGRLEGTVTSLEGLGVVDRVDGPLVPASGRRRHVDHLVVRLPVCASKVVDRA